MRTKKQELIDAGLEIIEFVTEAVIVRRINRRLRKDRRMLRRTRGLYVYDLDHNGVWRRCVDPKALARELGVLRADEYVVSPDDELLGGSPR